MGRSFPKRRGLCTNRADRDMVAARRMKLAGHCFQQNDLLASEFFGHQDMEQGFEGRDRLTMYTCLK
jgi:hypothetical protein